MKRESNWVPQEPSGRLHPTFAATLNVWSVLIQTLAFFSLICCLKNCSFSLKMYRKHWRIVSVLGVGLHTSNNGNFGRLSLSTEVFLLRKVAICPAYLHSLGEVIQISLPGENLNFIEGLASCCKCKNTARKWFLTCDPDEMLHHLMVYSPEVWGHGRQFPALKCIGIRSSQGKTGPFTQYICHGISLSLLTSFHLQGERDTTWPWSWWGQAMPICKYWCCWMGSQIMTLGCSLQHLVHYQSLGSNAEMVQLQKLHPQPNPKRPVSPWTSSLSSSRSPTQWCLEQVLLKESLHSILSEIRNQNMYDK